MRRVLIVDDSELILAQLEDILASFGYEAAGKASSGAEAILKARKLHPDVAVMDIVMPGKMDGIEAARLIREELDIPVILLTGHEDERLIETARDAGVEGYLLKPVKPGELKAAIEIALQRKRTEKELKDLSRDLIENTNDLIYALDGKGNIRYINNMVSRKLGYAHDDIVGKTFADFATPESFKRGAEIFKRQLKHEDVGAFELELKDRDGNTRIIETRERLVWKGGRVVAVHGIGRDVTERRRAEDSLRDSEQKYRELVEDIDDVLYVTDGTGKIKYLNKAFENVSGYSREELLNRNYIELLTPDSLEKISAIFKRQLAGEDVGIFEVNFRDKYGQTKTIQTREKFVWKDGKVVESHGIGRDVTKDRKAESALRESEEKYRILLENAKEAIVVIQDEVFKYANPKAREITGYAHDELMSKPFLEVVHPDDREEILSRYLREVAGENLLDANPYRIVGKDTSIRWVEGIGLAITWEGRPASLSFVTDVSERKRTEEELRRSEERYRTLFENAPIGIFHTSPEGAFIRANPALAHMLGYDSPDELISSVNDIAAQLYVDPNRRSEVVMNALEKDGWVYHESQYRRKDGKIIWGKLSLRPVYRQDGTIDYFEGFGDDITERRNTEKLLEVQKEIGTFLSDADSLVVSLQGVLDRILQIEEVDSGGVYLANPAADELDLIVHRGLSEDFVNAVSHIGDDYPLYGSIKEGRRSYLTDEDIRKNPLGDPEKEGLRAIVSIPIIHKGELVAVFNLASHTNGGFSPNIQNTLGIIAERLGGVIVRIRTQQQLRESEGKWRNLFESSRDVIYLSTVQGRFTDINPAGEQVFGYSTGELLRLDLIELYLEPQDREKFQKVIRTGGFVKDYETSFRKKDGSVIDCLLTSNVRKDTTGTIIGYQGIIRDITDKKRMEQQLLQTEKLSSMGTMISGVAHELNNPLAAVMGNAELLKRRKNLPDDVLTKLDVIHKESKRASKIVGGLLAFAREHRPERKMINVNDIISESVRLREYDLKVSDIAVRLSLSE